MVRYVITESKKGSLKTTSNRSEAIGYAKALRDVGLKVSIVKDDQKARINNTPFLYRVKRIR